MPVNKKHPIAVGKENNDETQNIALLMAVTCVRNTIIEKYHAAGKITDDEMAAFNREVANKLFTFMTYMRGTQEDFNDFIQLVSLNYPTNWDKPELDKDLVGALALFRKRIK